MWLLTSARMSLCVTDMVCNVSVSVNLLSIGLCLFRWCWVVECVNFVTTRKDNHVLSRRLGSTRVILAAFVALPTRPNVWVCGCIRPVGAGEAEDERPCFGWQDTGCVLRWDAPGGQKLFRTHYCTVILPRDVSILSRSSTSPPSSSSP